MRLFLQIKSGRILDILWGVFSKTIISLAVVALDKRRLIIANSALRALLAIYLPSHVQSAHVVEYSYLLCIPLVILSLRLTLGWCCFEWQHGTVVGTLFLLLLSITRLCRILG